MQKLGVDHIGYDIQLKFQVSISSSTVSNWGSLVWSNKDEDKMMYLNRNFTTSNKRHLLWIVQKIVYIMASFITNLRLDMS